MSFLDQIFFGNSLQNWGVALLIFVATFLVVPLIHGRIKARQQRWSQTSHSSALELLAQLAARTNRLVLLSAALYFAKTWLQWPENIDPKWPGRINHLFDVIIVVGVAVQLAIWAATALRFLIERHYNKAGKEDAGARASVGVLMFIVQLLVWTVFLLLALSNLGVDITALVAGMGVGGIAIALAVQTVLGDLFGSMSIALDKPFVVGDHLRVDDIEGTVEYIGIKSTRLRSLTGEQVIVANADMLKSRVRNLGRMAERRVLFRVGVTYETPPDKLELVTDLIRGAVEAVPATRFLQCPLICLGADSLEFELIFFVASQPGVSYGLTIGEVNKGIFRALIDAGIDFAYPTRRLLLMQAPALPEQ